MTEKQPLRIILIGSGAANTQAAITLKKQFSSSTSPHLSIRILEADNVPLGRLRQSPHIHPHNEIDIGGEIIHGESEELKNLMDQLVKEAGQPSRIHLRKMFDLKVPHENMTFFDTKALRRNKALRLEMSHLVQHLEDEKDRLCEEIANDVLQEPSNVHQYANVSLYDLYSQVIDEQLQKTPQLLEWTSKEDLLEMLESRYGKTFGSVDLKSLGAWDTYQEGELATDDDSENWVCSTGYSILRDYFLREIGQHIELNKKVTCVLLRENDAQNPVQVTYVDTLSDEECTTFCDIVIVGVPLTILQRNHIRFEPPLPCEKKKAIQKLQMSYGAKLFATFNNQTEVMKRWREYYDKCTIVFPGDDRYVAQVWLSSVPEDHTHMVITGFTTGDRAGRLCNLSTSQIEMHFKRLLTHMLGEDIMDKFYEKCYIQNWSMEPYIQGGYSSETVGSVGSRTELGVPVNKRIYFAGEHCCVSAPATVHGAMRSGQEAAHMIFRDRSVQTMVKSKL
mmetsp:Transcript_5965/g.22644  ORF Transcript_5965/g.22644 Transcript_5965/m.22644 type:complete len:506 (-) Transcript_5965:54-1571(-)